MLPYSLPSSVSAFGRRQMRAYPYTPQAGDVAWVDYIPVRFVPDNFQEGTYNQKGFVAIDIISSPTGRQAWVDYVPIVIDDTRTDAWLVNRVGYIPVNFSGTGDGTERNKGLSLNFVGADKLDPRITFSRASNATVTGSDGLIRFAPHNLLTFSEQFDNAAWVKTASGTGTAPVVTANFGVAPDGTTTADRVQLVAGAAGASQITQTPSGTSPGTATFSVWLRSLSDTVTVTLFNNGDVSNVSVGTSWQRYSFTRTATVSYDVRIAKRDVWGSAGTADLLVWGAQLEIGSTATAYNPTTVKNLLGFSEAFDNAAWTKSNSFIQTNLLTFSEQFDNASWQKVGSTVTANSTTAPNGSTTADTLVEDTSTGRHDVQITSGLSLVSGVAYTASVYAKASGRNFIQITFSSASHGTGQYANFNLATGAVGNNSGGTASIVNVGNGWYRCVFTATSTGTSTASQVIGLIDADTASRLPSYTGNGTSGVFIWGAQLVQGSVAGDYQQTTSSALPVMYQAPNGTMTADKLVENTTNAGHFLEQIVTGGTRMTGSYYVKAGERTKCVTYLIDSTGIVAGTTTRYNLTNGTAEVGTGSITAVGNGWYRISTSSAMTAGNQRFRLILVNASDSDTYTGDGTSGIYIWGAQLSDSASLDTYVNNPVAAPSSTAYYGPRFDYDPVTLQPRGLLIEEQRTNLLVQSEGFDTANWGKNGITVTANQIAAPDGTTTADLITSSAVAGYVYPANTGLFSAAGGATYTYSVYAKAGSVSSFDVLVAANATYTGTFNLSAGTASTVTANTTVAITNVGNGWYRCAVTCASVSNDAYSELQIGRIASGQTLYLWGAQLEAGAFATSYIPTTSAQVTRSADVALVQGSNFSSWYNVNEGSMFTNTISLYPNDSTTNSSGVISFNIDASNSNHIGLDPRRVRVVTGGVSQANITSISAIPSGLYRTAFAYATNDVVITTNNSAILSDTSVTLPSGFNRMAIGRGLALDGILNGHIRQIAYYPRRLSNSELQAITS